MKLEIVKSMYSFDKFDDYYYGSTTPCILCKHCLRRKTKNNKEYHVCRLAQAGSLPHTQLYNRSDDIFDSGNEDSICGCKEFKYKINKLHKLL